MPWTYWLVTARSRITYDRLKPLPSPSQLSSRGQSPESFFSLNISLTKIMALFSSILRFLYSAPAKLLTGGLLLQQPADVVYDPPLAIDQDTTVILGAGVIGLSTAYYLALALNENSTASLPDQPKVVVIEPSHDICPGASGSATGGLGDFGFSDAVSPLGKFSYSLHKDLALAHEGKKDWGFRDQTIFRVTPKDFNGDLSPPDSWGPLPPLETDLSSLPDWVKTSDDWSVQLLAPVPHSSHMYVSIVSCQRNCLTL